MSKAERALEARALGRMPWVLGVTGHTTISDSRIGFVGHSRALPQAKGVVERTQLEGRGLDPTIGGDEFSFSMPWQREQNLGGCFVAIPQIDITPIVDVGGSYFDTPRYADVELTPPTGTEIELDQTSPKPGPAKGSRRVLKYRS